MAEANQAEQTLGFQAEAKQLLQLMIHSLYSNREIFLRELISNASDAVDKLRFEALERPSLLEEDTELRIRISVDEEAKTITISDNGVGMSREEAIANLGTIAKSGTAEFLSKLSGDRKKDAALIGQFGVGFYSAFIVADSVDVLTRRAGEPEEAATRWRSSGESDFTVASDTKATRGTDVTLHLKDDAKDFADGYRLRNIVRKYSDHIGVAVEMVKQTVDADERKRRRKRTSRSSNGNRSTLRKLCGPARAPRSPTTNTRNSTNTSRTTSTIRRRGATTRSKASSNTRVCCTCRSMRHSICGIATHRAV